MKSDMCETCGKALIYLGGEDMYCPQCFSNEAPLEDDKNSKSAEKFLEDKYGKEWLSSMYDGEYQDVIDLLEVLAYDPLGSDIADTSAVQTETASAGSLALLTASQSVRHLDGAAIP